MSYGSRDYAEDQVYFQKFLNEFETQDKEDPSRRSVLKYFLLLEAVAQRKQNVVLIELDDIEEYFGNSNLVEAIEANCQRYLGILGRAVDEVMPPMVAPTDGEGDVQDVLRQHREQAARANQLDNDPVGMNNSPEYPAELNRRFEIQLAPRKAIPGVPLRLMRASLIGKLITVRAIVSRVSDVKPLVTVATYTCDQCSLEMYQEVVSRQFTPLERCPSEACTGQADAGRGLGGKLLLQTRGSKFVRFQSIRAQELPEEVPVGHIPRSVQIQLRGELAGCVSPGDVATFAGVFLPTPYEGYKAIRAGLIADTYIHGTRVIPHKKSYEQYELTPELRDRIEKFASTPDAFSRLAASLAPEIFGHEYVKKALLLLMVGGCTRRLPDGMKIRGDIHICLMGDPGVAKSQLLKHVARIAPRGIYTSGKGSSGVGLTAAVLRDPITNELALEGGSLVLADMGICAIDEFDKMEDADRTAIHEVMEQQTISIAKAGITTTLNARTAVLAAANPAYGRYNPNRSPTDNINLPAALLSRFDLMFLLLDRPDFDSDQALANHVTHVHRFREHPTVANAAELADPEFLRAYIAQARTVTPHVPDHLTDFIVNAYVNMRGEKEVQFGGGASGVGRAGAGEEFAYTTARTLLGILRLSQGLARLRFSPQIEEGDVKEAMHLMHMSKASLVDKPRVDRVDPISAVYAIIRDLATAPSQQTGAGAGGSSAPSSADFITYDSVMQRVVRRGYRKEDLDDCLSTYEQLGVFALADNGQKIKYIS